MSKTMATAVTQWDRASDLAMALNERVTSGGEIPAAEMVSELFQIVGGLTASLGALIAEQLGLPDE